MKISLNFLKFVLICTTKLIEKLTYLSILKEQDLQGVNGKVSKNLPPIANKTAKMIKTMNKNNLKPFDIFFDAT